ncbi:MAG: hypothetical protein GYA51_18800 [Candidatus Methanofastidiosa archaeon]|nr:hypothetical protein [Candidatus Methanofastidiosa archaeon]
MENLKVKLQRAQVYSVLKLIRAGLGKGKQSKSTTCELTFTDNKIDVAIPGAKFTVASSGIGAAKVTLPFFYLYDIIEKSNKPVLEISLGRNQMTINSLTIGVTTTFFEDDRILKTINIPLNYSDKDLLLLKKEKYTQEELDFNNLSLEIVSAEKNLEKNIEEAFKILKQYGIKKSDLRSLVEKSIFD